MKTKRGAIRQQKSRKNRQGQTSFEKETVIKFLSLLNTVKIYHWKTYSYATHKATDELYSKLNENIDRFMEVLL
jgi:DNA-binding ferritin-like protein